MLYKFHACGRVHRNLRKCVSGYASILIYTHKSTCVCVCVCVHVCVCAFACVCVCACLFFGRKGSTLFASTVLVVVWMALYPTGFRKPLSPLYKCDTGLKNV